MEKQVVGYEWEMNLIRIIIYKCREETIALALSVPTPTFIGRPPDGVFVLLPSSTLHLEIPPPPGLLEPSPIVKGWSDLLLKASSSCPPHQHHPISPPLFLPLIHQYSAHFHGINCHHCLLHVLQWSVSQQQPLE
ncbi:putative tRNA-methyl transferase [Sesbania bispinosa]|nr:putative tRNA-methyl transferase [Sesbania bispinosa]